MSREAGPEKFIGSFGGYHSLPIEIDGLTLSTYESATARQAFAAAVALARRLGHVVIDYFGVTKRKSDLLPEHSDRSDQIASTEQ